jgi:hypothetical protein
MSNISIHCYSGNGSCDMLWLGCQASSLERSLCPSSTTLCPDTTVDGWMDDDAIRCISKDLSFTEDYWNLCYLCCNGSFVKLWTPSRGLYYKYYDSQRSKAIQHQYLHQQTPLGCLSYKQWALNQQKLAINHNKFTVSFNQKCTSHKKLEDVSNFFHKIDETWWFP